MDFDGPNLINLHLSAQLQKKVEGEFKGGGLPVLRRYFKNNQ